jgi:serine/threonine-protein kinase RsbW
MSHPGFELRLPAVPASVPAARQALREFLAGLDMADERCEEVMLAVNEACANAVIHAYRGGPGDVEVRAAVREGQVHIDILDSGVGMSPRLDSPGLGVGLPTMVMLADSVQIDRPQGGGTHVRMRFGDRPVAEAQAASGSRSPSRIDERP